MDYSDINHAFHVLKAANNRRKMIKKTHSLFFKYLLAIDMLEESKNVTSQAVNMFKE